MRVILIRLSALGDIIHTWPLVDALKAVHPDAHLTWVIERAFEPLILGHPAVDATITTATSRWRRHPIAAATRAEIATVKTRLRELQPDISIDPQGTTKSAVISRWARAPRRIGLARPWRREWLAGLAYTETAAGAPAGAHVVETNVALLQGLGIKSGSGHHPDGSWLLTRIAGRRPEGSWDAPYAVVLPGTGGAHKVLPTTTLGKVCQGVSGLGLRPVVVWGPGEEDRAAEVVEAGGSSALTAPPTDIEEMAAIIGGASLVVGGDTGPVHLAASFGVPTVAVFLASDWRRNGPLGPSTAVVSGASEGRPRPSGTARVSPQRPVTADEIVSAARDLLARDR